MGNREYLTTSELAEIMGLSRVQVFRKIKAGEIPAERIGNIYAIPREFAASLSGEMTSSDERKIEKGIIKVIEEYGEVLKKLADQ